MNTQGRLVASNSSNTIRAITLANAGDMAVLAVPDVPSSRSFNADTFGARAQCTSMVPFCQWGTAKGVNNTSPVRNVTCSTFSDNFPPVKGYDFHQLPNAGEAKSIMWSTACTGLGCTPQTYIPNPDHNGAPWLSPGQKSKNPVEVWLQMAWGQLINVTRYQVSQTLLLLYGPILTCNSV
jgi:hypothetical protein